MKIAKFAFCAAVFFGTLDASPAAARGSYVSPFAAPTKVGKKPPKNCIAPPTPIVTLSTESRYLADDQSKSKADPQRELIYEKSIAPLRVYSKGVVRMANAYALSKGQDKNSAECAMRWLSIWVEANALSDMRTHTAQFNRSTTLAALSLAYMQIQNYKPSGPDPRPAIVKWIESQANAVRFHYLTIPDEARSKLNNHRYWAGLSAAAAAIVSDSVLLYDWGMESYRIGVCQVTAEGWLPLEMQRESRALSYHTFALAPLMMLAEIGELNGDDTYSLCGSAIDRLVTFTLVGIDDPSTVTALNGAQQSPLSSAGKFDASDVAWLEIYDRRFAMKNIWHNRMKEIRPLTYSGLGGDLTMLLH